MSTTSSAQCSDLIAAAGYLKEIGRVHPYAASRSDRRLFFQSPANDRGRSRAHEPAGLGAGVRQTVAAAEVASRQPHRRGLPDVDQAVRVGRTNRRARSDGGAQPRIDRVAADAGARFLRRHHGSHSHAARTHRLGVVVLARSIGRCRGRARRARRSAAPRRQSIHGSGLYVQSRDGIRASRRRCTSASASSNASRGRRSAAPIRKSVRSFIDRPRPRVFTSTMPFANSVRAIERKPWPSRHSAA